VEPNFRTLQQFVNDPRNKDNPVYFYKFNFSGPYSYSTLFSGSPNYFGVIHCDELIYTLRSSVLFPDFPANSIERNFTKTWINFLVGFAYTG
jgi:juvenile-hormone esterase